MRNFKFLFVLLTLAAITLSSCKKVEGPEGPQGPAGSQGPVGNANVQEVDMTINIADLILWSYNNSYYVYKSLSQASNDAVLGYVYKNSEWNSLTFINYFNTSSYFNAYSFSIADDNSIYISIRNSSGGAPFSDMTTGTLSYRFIIVKAATYAAMPDNIDISNYDEVKTYFKLKN